MLINIMNKNKKRTLFSTNDNFKINHYNLGFTIVELLVVIVVIGTLAAITTVSYTGISNRAKVVALQSDLTNSSKQIKLFQVNEASGNYPTANNCPTPGTTEICLKSSNDNTYTYAFDNTANPKIFALNAANGTTVYQITNSSSPITPPVSLLVITDPTNWLTIGTQTWAKANLNVGTMITRTTNQTHNGILEKYCYNNLESNCTTYGALYLWDEAMQYVTTEGAQGICPTGSHIPTDNDWKILEMQLGMTQAQADAVGNRGTDQGAKLKTGGSSGLDVPLAGYRVSYGSISNVSITAYLFSSSGWYRYLGSSFTIIGRAVDDKTNGFSVRCIGN